MVPIGAGRERAPGAGVGRRALDRVAGSPLAHALARAGFGAKALLYGNIGYFALRRAWGWHGPLLDVKGALARLARSSIGPPLSALTGVGIACLGCWFVIEALSNPAARRGAWGAISRVGQAAGGLGYVGLGAVGVRILLGLGVGPSGDALARTGVAEALGIPGGPLFAGVLGVVGVGVGIRQAAQGITRSFRSSLDLSRAPAAVRRLAAFLGTVGFTAQGALFASAGALILRATLARAPREAAGTRGVLARLAHQPSGSILLGTVALGLLAYAAYAVVEAGARRFPGASGRVPGEATVNARWARTRPSDGRPGDRRGA
jgi:hypothetical protein